MKILFQGDSVTDCQRDRSDPLGLGKGYVRMIAGQLGGGDLVQNRGISGNRVLDLAERWDEDCLDLKPDLVSILIGINDVWRHFDRDQRVDFKSVRKRYRDLLDRIVPLSPKLVLMEPFLIPSCADKEEFRPVLDPIIGIVRDMAIEYGAALVPLDGLFAAACLRRPAGHWAEDGIHPTVAGHRFIADAWLETYRSTFSQDIHPAEIHQTRPT